MVASVQNNNLTWLNIESPTPEDITMLAEKFHFHPLDLDDCLTGVHRPNETIKVLTMFSVVLLPMTLLTGVYGMNIINLPLAKNPFSLLVLMGVMGFIGVVMIVIFKLKRWL